MPYLGRMKKTFHIVLSGILGWFILFSSPGAARTSFVHEVLYDVSIMCTNLREKPANWQNNGGLNAKQPSLEHGSVQMRFVIEPKDRTDEILSVMFWNVENFFDWRNDSATESDLDFSSGGERHWTWKRFQAKANAFAKALFWVEGETGRLPDVVGLEEVENAFVLRQVLQRTALRKTDYKYVHYDSPDRRGIDVALLYRSSVLDLIDSKPCHLYAADTVMATRDILLCVFKRKASVMPDPDRASMKQIPGQAGNDETIAVLVNHHPSKYGGAAESDPRRRIAVERLRFLADSLASIGIDRIIAGGDFNDTPDNPVFRLLEPVLIPLHVDLYHRGLGTIKYDGKWDLIDHIYVSPGWTIRLTPARFSSTMASPSEVIRPEGVIAIDSTLASDPPGAPGFSMRILRIPFLQTRDTAHSGEKPLRTYTGPRYTGGVSDHLPVLLEMVFPP